MRVDPRDFGGLQTDHGVPLPTGLFTEVTLRNQNIDLVRILFACFIYMDMYIYIYIYICVYYAYILIEPMRPKQASNVPPGDPNNSPVKQRIDGKKVSRDLGGSALGYPVKEKTTNFLETTYTSQTSTFPGGRHLRDFRGHRDAPVPSSRAKDLLRVEGSPIVPLK